MKAWNLSGAMVLGALAAILAMGHFPGWDAAAATWLPVGEIAWDWTLVGMGAAAGLWQRDMKIPIRNGGTK